MLRIERGDDARELVALARQVDVAIDELIVRASKATTEGDAKAILKEGEEQLEVANTLFVQTVKAMELNCSNAAEKAWQLVVKTKSQYKTYQLKAGVKLAFTGAELVVNLAEIAGEAAASFGPAAIVGLIGLARTLTSAGAQIYNLCREAEGVLDTLDKDLKSLNTAYTSKSRLVAQELTSSVLNEFFDGPFLNNIEKCTNNAELASNKIKGIVVGSHKVSVALAKLLKQVEKVESEAKGIADEGKRKKAIKRLQTFADEVQTLIEKIVGQHNRAETAQERLAKLLPLLKAVQAKDSKAVKIVAKLVSLSLDFGLALTDSGGNVLKALESMAVDMGKGFVEDEIIDALG